MFIEIESTYTREAIQVAVSEWEFGFFQDNVKRERKYGAGFKCSDKQQAILARIVAKLEGKSPAADQPESLSDLGKVIDMMQLASLSLKYPKIKMKVGDFPVKLTIAGNNAKHPGTVNITDGGPYGVGRFYGRILRDGTWAINTGTPKEVIAAVALLGADPEHAMSHYGKLAGSCCFCSKDLSTDNSLEVGYGPVCAAKYGLKWGGAHTHASERLMNKMVAEAEKASEAKGFFSDPDFQSNTYGAAVAAMSPSAPDIHEPF